MGRDVCEVSVTFSLHPENEGKMFLRGAGTHPPNSHHISQQNLDISLGNVLAGDHDGPRTTHHIIHSGHRRSGGADGSKEVCAS
jgi:hypothetical protein